MFATQKQFGKGLLICINIFSNARVEIHCTSHIVNCNAMPNISDFGKARAGMRIFRKLEFHQFNIQLGCLRYTYSPDRGKTKIPIPKEEHCGIFPES